MDEKKNNTAIWWVVGILVLLVLAIVVWKVRQPVPVSIGEVPVTEEITTEELTQEEVPAGLEEMPLEAGEGEPEEVVLLEPELTELSCTGDYSVRTLFYNDEGSGVMQNLTLEVTEPGLVYEYAMMPVESASGSRYATVDGEYWWWEHQGEMTFGMGEETLTTCHE